MKYVLAVVLVLVGLSGCSGKEMKDGAKDIGNDISNFGDKIFKVRE